MNDEEKEWCGDCKHQGFYDAPLCMNKECVKTYEKQWFEGIWIPTIDFWKTCKYYSKEE